MRREFTAAVFGTHYHRAFCTNLLVQREKGRDGNTINHTIALISTFHVLPEIFLFNTLCQCLLFSISAYPCQNHTDSNRTVLNQRL